MARHGYLREYDEAPDRDEDRERDRAWGEDRGFMLDRDRDREDERGFFERMGDRARSSFRDDDRQWRSSHDDQWRPSGSGSSVYGREHGHRTGFRGDQGRFGAWDRDRSPRDFSSRQDDHYLSWRERQMQALDRDYADYCREREQQFHSDFDTWRRNRQQSAGQNEAMGEAGELELTHERALAEEGNTPSPVGEATLGTNNSENTSRGRR